MTQSNADLRFVEVYGADLGHRLAWLERVVGSAGLEKFLDSKAAGAGTGLYMLTICLEPSHREIAVHVLDTLAAGNVAAVIDINSYYRNGKVRPAGMQIVDGNLVDVWSPT